MTATETAHTSAFWRERDGAWFRLADRDTRAQTEAARRFPGEPGVIVHVPLDVLRERIRRAAP